MTNRTTKRIKERPDRYLKPREGIWHYQRRVPKRLAHLDDRGLIQKTLETDSLDEARLRRDAIETADEAYWSSLQASGSPGGPVALELYKAAQARALSLGFAYRTLEDLATVRPLDDLVQRIEVLDGMKGGVESARPLDVKALLGGALQPVVRVTEAMEDHIKAVGPLENLGKSPGQIASWKKVKRRAAKNFAAVCGDLAMFDIERVHGVQFHDWWRDRITGPAGTKKLAPNSANRDLGNMRNLYREHFARLGEEDRLDPFRKLSFKDPKSKRRSRPPFATDFIRSKLLDFSAWQTLNADAALIFLALVETGCRPSEICNIQPDSVRLDAAIPHLSIEYRDDRAIKTETSVRVIPLLGVSLAAMQARPLGFPRYYDKETTLSSTLMKHFRTHGLLPTDKHKVYSIRHSYEDRMLEGGVDGDLRRRIMGHMLEGDRPDYGTGGSLAYRAEELSRIVLPFPDDLVSRIVESAA